MLACLEALGYGTPPPLSRVSVTSVPAQILGWKFHFVQKLCGVILLDASFEIMVILPF